MLWEEIFVCIKNLEIGYADVLMMPTNERRFYLGLMVKKRQDEQAMIEQIKEKQSSNSKGARTSKVSGDALKSKLKSGEIPLT